MYTLVMPYMDLKQNCGSDKAWVWTTTADFADEEKKSELLAIRFANAESKICDMFSYKPSSVIHTDCFNSA